MSHISWYFWAILYTTRRYVWAERLLLDHLRTALDLARKNFPPIERLTVRMWTDPLEGTEMVRLGVAVAAGLTDASEGYWYFLGDWTKAAPLPDRDLIRVSYTPT